jgi:hypothetical protein
MEPVIAVENAPSRAKIVLFIGNNPNHVPDLKQRWQPQTCLPAGTVKLPLPPRINLGLFSVRDKENP